MIYNANYVTYSNLSYTKMYLEELKHQVDPHVNTDKMSYIKKNVARRRIQA